MRAPLASSVRRLTAQAREQGALFYASMDALSTRVVILDDRGTIIAANAAWDWPAGGMDVAAGPRLGDNYATWLATLRVGADLSRLRAVLRAVISGDRRECREEYAVTHRAGKSWFQIRAKRFTSEGRLYIIVAYEDITEIKQAAEALRALAGRVLHAQDDERRRIARDLHDSTCQNLLAASLIGDRLKGLVSERGHPVLLEMREMIERSIRELRTLSYVLHPPLLEQCGLAAALREYVRGFSQRSGIRVALEVSSDVERSAPATENALFRVMQESLANVHRHSGSSAARVRLFRTGNRLVLSVADRGRGIGPVRSGSDDGSVSLGVGIPGMRARLRQLDGDVALRSGTWGTMVRAYVPIDADRLGISFGSAADDRIFHGDDGKH